MTQQEFFNRYKYNTSKDLLGEGGFGRVFKAYDELLGREVAIKIALVKENRENLSLLKEVELAKKLPHHRNIAHYEECFRYDSPSGDTDYGILQYYPAGNLSQLIKAKKLTFDEKEQIAKGMIKGIEHLHSHNIIHRDIKSANVLMSQSPSGEYVPKIADFGLSKEFKDNSKSYFSNSFAGGSLLYAAPEQHKGDALRKNADLWSLGVMLFELFTGEVPFAATKDDGTETARKEIMQKIETAQIPATIDNIPLPWKKIIEQCLTVDSDQRIKDTKAIWAIVNDTAGITIIDDPEPPKPKPKPDPKKLPWLWIGGGLLALIVAIALLLPKGENPEPTPPTTATDTTNTTVTAVDTPPAKAPQDEALAAEAAAWEKAKTSRNIEQLKAFLQTYPDGIYQAPATQLLNSLEQAKIDADNEAANLKAEEDARKAEAKRKAEAEAKLKAANLKAEEDARKAEAKRKADEEAKRKDPFASQMKYISGGSFSMGSNDGDSDEKPVHTVSLSGFNISRYEVTQKQWRDIMGTSPSHFKNCDNCPVEQVSWNDIQDFLRKLNAQTGKRYRLPTEAEWEYAARGGQSYTYAGSDNLGSVAWYDGNSGSKTHPVGQKSANGYGLYDMSGNVWEWCQDTWHDNYNGAPTNGSAWTSGGDNSRRVLRGGSWVSGNSYCRSSYRGRDVTAYRDSSFGFRLARD